MEKNMDTATRVPNILGIQSGKCLLKQRRGVSDRLAAALVGLDVLRDDLQVLWSFLYLRRLQLSH